MADSTAMTAAISMALSGAVDAGLIARDDVVCTLTAALVEALAELPEHQRDVEIDKLRTGIVDAVRAHLGERRLN